MEGLAVGEINYPLLLQQTYQEALDRNENECKHWRKLKEEYASLQALLKELPNELTKDVMVPVAPRALMRGTMTHTNEILVCLGQGYFVKRSAAQAASICVRREKICSDMLQSLEKERELFVGRKEIPLQQDAFGGEREIIEVHSEEEEAHWRVEHKRKEKEYRQKLAQLKTKEKTTVVDEESLWQRLDELELQEELEEELDRMHADGSDEEGEEEEEQEEEEQEEEEEEINQTENEKLSKQSDNGCDGIESQRTSSAPSRRRVSFAAVEVNTDPEEELKINFHHSPVPPAQINSKPANVEGIKSPAEFYEYFRNQFLVQPRSILKKSCSYDDNNTGNLSRSESSDPSDVETDNMLDSSVSLPLPVLEDVVERDTVMNNQLPTSDRPVSRFKALRQLKKR